LTTAAPIVGGSLHVHLILLLTAEVTLGQPHFTGLMLPSPAVMVFGRTVLIRILQDRARRH
jgi:hypothetical protein